MMLARTHSGAANMLRGTWVILLTRFEDSLI